MKRVAYLLGAVLALGAGTAAAAQTRTPSASVQSGIAAFERGDYDSAIKQWRPLAAKGDADAQFNLAQAYRMGRGVPQDLPLAESWYEKAARQGHREAEDNYGLAMFQNGKRKEAMPWIEKSAARGDPRAQYVLGTAQFNGDFAPKDWVRAYALMTRSAAAGFPKAGPVLAEMDKYIPLEQRQRGTVLARDLELQAMRAQPPVAGPGPAAPLPPPVQVASGPGTSYPEPGKPPVSRVLPKSIAAPAAVTAPAPAASGRWRIQLGAFGNPDNADILWKSLRRDVSGLSAAQPFLVKSGSITRLQAGPFASRAAADRQCAAIKANGQACLTVQP